MLPAIVLVGAFLFLVFKFLQSSGPLLRPVGGAEKSLPELGSGDYQETAAIASGPDRGFGVLRVTPTQLVFAGNSGRVTTIERLDITGVTTTTELPDHVSAKPVLAVAAGGAVHYFAVDDPASWERRLL